MYTSFFKLSGKPFQLNPDPAFFYGSRGHRRAMAYLEYGLHQSEGFIVITGEIGAGKTKIVRSLFEQLDPERVAEGVRGVGRHDQRLAPVPGEPRGGGRGQGRLADPALAREQHDPHDRSLSAAAATVRGRSPPGA